MIRPIQKKKDVYGIQGKVAFDPARPDTDIRLYKEIEKFLQGDMGLGGSGGTLANKLKTAKSYQASHVFGSRGEREIATERLDQQLTYFLNTQLGDAAKAAKMTIPGYLQSKGIHGISQIGTGDDAKYSAYRRDDFLQVSQNPVTGSTEKLVKAYMKGIGAAFNTSGGTNENRRLTALLRPDEAAFVNKQIKDTAKRVNAGEYPKGDLEAFYASTSQREELRNKIKTSKNERAMALVSDPESPVMAELKSKIKLQEAHKQAVKAARQQLVDEGEIEPDEEEKKEKKNKTSKVASQAMLLVINNLKNIATMVGGMLGVIKQIAMDISRSLQSSSANNIDPNTADRMRRWGAANKVYTGGNDYLLLDAVSSIDAKYGYAERLDNLTSGLDTTLSKKYARPIIDVATELYKTKDPLGAAKKLFGSFASMYMNAKPGKERNEELRAQLAALEQAFDKIVVEAYRAMLTEALAHGRINKKNAYNLFDIELRTTTKLSSGVDTNDIGGPQDDATDFKLRAKEIGDILADLEKLRNKIITGLINNIDLISNALTNLIDAILRAARWLGVEGLDDSINDLAEHKKKESREKYTALANNTVAFREDAKRQIESYLTPKKLAGDNLQRTTVILTSTIEQGLPLPEKYKDLMSGERGFRIASDLAMAKTGAIRLGTDFDDVQKGNTIRAADPSMLYQHSISEIKEYSKKYGIAPRVVSADEIKARTAKGPGEKKKAQIKELLKKIDSFKKEEVTTFDKVYRAIFFYGWAEEDIDRMFNKNNILKDKTFQEVIGGDDYDEFLKDAAKKSRIKLFNKNDNDLLISPVIQRIASINKSSFFDTRTGASKGASATEQDQDRKIITENIVALKINSKEVYKDAETYNEAAQRRTYIDYTFTV